MSDWQTGFVRLGKSVQELAYDQLEELLGSDIAFDHAWGDRAEGKPSGHRPPRADIQKLKKFYDLLNNSNQGGPEDTTEQWEELTGLTMGQDKMLEEYRQRLKGGSGEPDYVFDHMVKEHGDDPLYKKELGDAIKKQEISGFPQLYEQIQGLLVGLYNNWPGSYKLWPWAVKQWKDQFAADPIQRPSSYRHFGDVVGEAGDVLNRLRAENQIPQGFNIHDMDPQSLEDWLMQWKKDNRESEAQGEVVYQFHDGWTIQRLTTPEQLQFEGDEMSHCIGGYASSVETGEDVIYSLRDPKGMPHVTMEVDGVQGYHAGEDRENAPLYQAEYFAPHNPPDPEQVSDHRGMKLVNPTFDVVQIQGNANTTPKPEYQRKIREFLDSLREQGVQFVKSENWYAPHDEPEGDEHRIDTEWNHRYPSNQAAKEMMDWYDDYYSANPEKWQKGGEDAYGLQHDRPQVYVPDWKELIQHVLAGLTEEHDRDRYTFSHWKDAAQATYHMYWVEVGETPDPEKREKEKQNLLDAIQEAQEKLWDWETSIAEAYEELGGTWREDEWSEHNEESATNPELWEEAREKAEEAIREAYAGDAYKYIQYLYDLVEGLGGHNASELPNPNETNGGLPSPDEIRETNKAAWSKPPDEPSVPGTFSGWVPKA